jgi:ATP-dependent helicase/nuclease subunit B
MPPPLFSNLRQGYDELMPAPNPGSATLLIGPAGSGKTAAALAEYAAALREVRKSAAVPRRAMWVAPNWDVAAEIRERLVDEVGPVLDPGVTTFAGLAADLVRMANLPLTKITSLEQRRVVGRLIAESAAAGDLAYFGPVAQTPGFVTLVLDEIAAYQAGGYAPQEVLDQARGDGDARRIDLAGLLVRYRGQLDASGLVDDQTLVVAAGNVPARSPQILTGVKLAIVDGFAKFTEIEHRLLAELRRHVERLLVTLPGDSAGEGDATSVREDLFAAPRATVDGLRRLGRGAEIRRLPPPAERPWPALAHLERNLFRDYGDIRPPAPAVAASLHRLHIIEASGVQAEIVAIARRVKRLLVDGAAPQEIVVAFRSLREAGDRVRHVFADYGIPTNLPEERRLASSALVRSLDGVLRLVAEDWPYRRVLQVAADRSLRLFDADAPRRDPRRAIELCVRHAQLASGRRALTRQLAAWAEEPERTREPTTDDAALASSSLRKFAGVVRYLPKRAGIERWITALGWLAEGVGLLRPATRDAEANWGILASALRTIGRVDASTGYAEEQLTLAEFLEVFAATVAQAPAAQTGDGVGCVRVWSAAAAQHVRPRHLFVGGLSEQSFPAPLGATTPASAADARGDEMLLFYRLVTRPAETLTLSYPALDERAQTLPPSPYLVELERAFGEQSLPREVQPLNYSQPASTEGDAPPLGLTELRRAAVSRALQQRRELLAALVKATGSAGGFYVDARPGPSMLAGIEAIARRSRRDEFGAFDGILDSPAAAAHLARAFGSDHLWSPSRLEQYASCPFLFFGQQLLRLQPAPELALASDVRRRGSVLHETLAQLYAALRGGGVDPAQLTDMLTQQFHAALSAVAESRPGRGVDAAIREIERRQIAAWAEAFARQDADYRAAWSGLDAPPEPRYFEARFGPGSQQSESTSDAVLSTDQPFELTVPIGGAHEAIGFTGQIDRIDVGRVGDAVVFNVIDYKTSAYATVKDQEIHAGRQVQLPLYALAVEELLLASEQAAALSAGYWSIRGKGFAATARSGGPLAIRDVRDGKLVPAPSWSTTRDKLVARIGEIIAAIRRGHFPVYNEDDQCTSLCELRTICRVAHIRSLEKVWPVMEKQRGNGARMNADAADQRGSEEEE